MFKLIDSHCHLPSVENETAQILERAKAEEIIKVINVGTNIEDSFQNQKTHKVFPDACFSVGIYPHEEKNSSTENLYRKLKNLISDEIKPIAIGECGIDITENNPTPLERQKELFIMQIQLAIENNLPLIIHNRNGTHILIEILRKYSSLANKGLLRGVVHCFTGTWEEAQLFLELNLFLGFTGIITYKNAGQLLETVEKAPLQKILVETDSPYLTPIPYKGKTNEPKYVRIVAQKVAETRKLPLSEVCINTYKNTTTLFKIS